MPPYQKLVKYALPAGIIASTPEESEEATRPELADAVMKVLGKETMKKGGPVFRSNLERIIEETPISQIGEVHGVYRLPPGSSSRGQTITATPPGMNWTDAGDWSKAGNPELSWWGFGKRTKETIPATMLSPNWVAQQSDMKIPSINLRADPIKYGLDSQFAPMPGHNIKDDVIISPYARHWSALHGLSHELNHLAPQSLFSLNDMSRMQNVLKKVSGTRKPYTNEQKDYIREAYLKKAEAVGIKDVKLREVWDDLNKSLDKGDWERTFEIYTGSNLSWQPRSMGEQIEFMINGPPKGFSPAEAMAESMMHGRWSGNIFETIVPKEYSTVFRDMAKKYGPGAAISAFGLNLMGGQAQAGVLSEQDISRARRTQAMQNMEPGLESAYPELDIALGAALGPAGALPRVAQGAMGAIQGALPISLPETGPYSIPEEYGPK